MRVPRCLLGLGIALAAAGAKAEEPPRPQRPTFHSHLAVNDIVLRDLTEGRRLAEAGLALAATSTNPQRMDFFTGAFAVHLAWAANEAGDHRAGLRHGEEAIQSLERYLAKLPAGPRHEASRRNAGRVLGLRFARLATARRRLGRLPEAETAARRAVSVARGAGHAGGETGALLASGWIALVAGDAPRGLQVFREAEGAAVRANLHERLIWAHAGMGSAHPALGQHGEALAAFQRAVDQAADVRARLQGAGLRGSFLGDKQVIYQGALRSALALGRPAEAFGYAERARARAFLDLLGGQTSLSKGRTQALVAEEVRLRAQLAEAQAVAAEARGPDEGEGDPGRDRQRLEAARQAYRAFLERVRRENLEQASMMTMEPATVEGVRRHLPEGVSLLEFLVTPSETFLRMVDAQRLEVLRIPVTRRELVAAVRAFRQAVARRASPLEVETQARNLYDQLVALARAHIRGDRLLIIPNDILHYLPFGALRMPEGRWPPEEFTLATLPSASVPGFLAGKGAAAPGPALAVGNPDVGSALALRYAEREARLVGQRYPGSAILVRGDATEAKAKVLGETATVLHFATHGELDDKDPLSSALLLVPDSKEDGRLEVREIFGLDLQARLVVLSACETGLGRLSRGDELVGLQRAFLYAGTPAVVTTLWKVDDRASYRLMEHFYAQLDAQGAAGALRQAQRATMAEFPHPFAWAAFGLTGVPK